MIVSPNGSQMTQGQTVLVWGRDRRYRHVRAQYVLNGGGTPVGVVLRRRSASRLERNGCEAVIDRRAEDYKFWNAGDTEQDPAEWLRFGKKIRSLVGPQCRHRVRTSGPFDDGRVGVRRQARRHDHHVRGHVGIQDRVRQSLSLDEPEDAEGVSFANYREAWGANRLVCDARIHPTMSKVYPLDQTGEAALQVHHNLVEGKVSVLCLAPEEGLGVTDEATRAVIWIRSRCSAGARSERRSAAWTCCSPRSTTLRSPSTTSRPRSTLPRHLRLRGRAPRGGGE